VKERGKEVKKKDECGQDLLGSRLKMETTGKVLHGLVICKEGGHIKKG